jgi:hypothetical protein
MDNKLAPPATEDAAAPAAVADRRLATAAAAVRLEAHAS